jgi:hypothetical protein
VLFISAYLSQASAGSHFDITAEFIIPRPNGNRLLKQTVPGGSLGLVNINIRLYQEQEGRISQFDLVIR